MKRLNNPPVGHLEQMERTLDEMFPCEEKPTRKAKCPLDCDCLCHDTGGSSGHTVRCDTHKGRVSTETVEDVLEDVFRDYMDGYYCVNGGWEEMVTEATTRIKALTERQNDGP